MRLKKLAMLLAVLFVMTSLPVFAQTANVWKEFYVSPSGNDSNPGTKEAPFATVEKAKNAVREVNSSMQGDIIVNILDGTYYLDKMLDFTVEDSGKNGFNVIYLGENGKLPTISGGKKLTGFTESEEIPGVYQLLVEDADKITSLYVNGKRRYMAKAASMVKGLKKPEKYDNEQWYNEHPDDIRDDHYNWYDVNTPYSYDGFYMSKEDVSFYENQQDILFLWDDSWKTHIIPVQEIMPDPDNSEQVIVRMKEALWNFAARKNQSMSNYPRPQKDFVMMNAMEFLDEPGEFYFNRQTKILYYMPYSDEDMVDAEVILPDLENLMIIRGNDVDDKVKNVTFSGIKFAHSRWDNWTDGYIGQQGSSESTTSGTLMSFVYPDNFGAHGVVPGTIIVEMADNVNFNGNYFFGFGGAALDLANGVRNSNVTGNAFSDLGDGAIFIGSTMHNPIGTDGVSDAPPADAGLLSLTDMLYHKIEASFLSSWDKGRSGLRILAGGSSPLKTTYPDDMYKTWVDEYHYIDAWKSDPNAPARGEKSWVCYDFLKPYSMEKITLAFDPNYVSDSEKSRFEVLVSNDRSFKDGSYKVVATQTSPADEVQEYKVDSDEKYQYIMVRTLGATPLALSRLWAFTDDYKPYTKYEICKNINVTNNYINRVGLDIHKATGVLMHYAANITINHNEVTDAGYSGMGLGWGWSTAVNNTKDNDYSYNYIHNVTQTMHDGGGLYTLSRAVNTTAKYNFIENIGVGARAYYSDEGTASILYEHNAFENATYSFSPYRASVIDNIYRNNYGTHTAMSLHTETLNDIETVNTYVAGQPSKEAYAIIENAGLQPEYEHIKTWVKDADNNLHDKLFYFNSSLNDYAARTRATVAEVSTMINQGIFGEGLGMFKTIDKERLEKALSSFNGASSSQQMAKLLELEAVSREVKKNVNRLSMNDTLALCKETLDKTKVVSDEGLSKANQLSNTDTFGMDLKTNVDSFEKIIQSLEQKASKATTKEAEFEVLVELEKAYNDFMSKRLSADIEYVSAKGAIKTEVDKTNATVKVIMPQGEDLTSVEVDIVPSGSAEIALVMNDTLDLTKPYTVPMYCAANDKYKFWKIEASIDEGVDADINKNSTWYTKSNLTKAVKKEKDGTVITASPYSYMTNSYNMAQSGASVNFKPITPNETNDFTFIIGADIYEGLEVKNSDALNDRCEVLFKGTEASLYTVVNGTKKLIKTTDTTLSYNEKNNFTYSLQKINDTTQVLVKLNGETIFSEVLKLTTEGGYFGINTDKINIKIY